LTNQSLLTEFALNVQGDFRKRCAAIEVLADQNLVTQLALYDINVFVRTAAIKRLTDQSLLKQFAAESDYIIRTAAVHNLTDRTLLAKVAVEDEYSSVRKAATDRLNVLQGRD
jgi:hypothetical protein